MRILHILDHSLPLHSGYAFRSRSILHEQRRRGWDTFHVTTPRHTADGPDPETIEALAFHRTGAPVGWRSRIRLPYLSVLAEIRATADRTIEVARRVQPDILHAHSPALAGMAALKAGRCLGIPVAYEIRSTWEDAAVIAGKESERSVRYRLSRALENRVTARADAVFVICEGLRGEFLQRGCPPEKLTVVPNAVDLDQFPPIAEKDEVLGRQLGLTGAEVVGFLGSFYEYEGLDTLIHAVAILSASRPNVRLLLAGGGPQEESLKALTTRLGLEGRVLNLGRIPNSEVNRYYSLVDILAYPRKRTRLTELVTPLKPLEAMAQCKLVAASDVGGHRELIAPGETGALFEPDDPASLARTLTQMFENRASWPELQRRALEFVRKERTWQRSVDRYWPIYDRLVGRRPPRSRRPRARGARVYA